MAAHVAQSHSKELNSAQMLYEAAIVLELAKCQHIVAI